MRSRRVPGGCALSGLILFAIVAVGCGNSTGVAGSEVQAASTSVSSEPAPSSTTIARLPSTSLAASSVPIVTPPPSSSLPQDEAGGWRRLDLPALIAPASMIATGPRGNVAFGGYGLGARPGTAGWFSADGSTWTPIDGLQQMIDGGDGAESGFGWVSAVAAGPSGFVALGAHLTFPDEKHTLTANAVWSSPDGRTWTRVGDIDALGADRLPIALVRGAEAFVALTTPPIDKPGRSTLGPVVAWRSVDGQSWQPVTIDEHAYGLSIAATSFGFVAVGLGSSFSPLASAMLPAIWISSDGITWRRIVTDVFHSAPSVEAFIRVVPYGDGAALIARQFESDNGSDNAMTIFMTTADGEHWRNISAPPCLTAARRDYLIDFAASRDRFMILASIGAEPALITRTPDGAQWRCSRIDPEVFPTTAWGPPSLWEVAVNPNGTFSILGGTALETLNKPNYQAAIWMETR